MQKNRLALSIALALAGFAGQVAAQGTNLQGPTPPLPTPSNPAAVAPQAPPARPAATPTGVSVELKSVEITGNQAVDTATLLAQLGDVTGQRLDVAALNAMAAKLEAFYRRSGYIFASVFLPPQNLSTGQLRISVLEGAFGRVQATSAEPVLAQGAQPFLDAGIQAGDVIRNDRLERVLLVLDDQPGIRIRPVISPGAQLGQADLRVETVRDSRVSGEVSVDNIGARSTGENRLRGNMAINSPFIFGDRITLNALVTDEQMWLGSVDYDRPLGASGLRGQIGYAHTNYQLAGQFASLDARGLAKVSSARLSYPLVRSQARNATLSVGVQHKDLRDEYRAAGTTLNKRSDSFPIGLQFDNSDRLLGGGLTYGSLVWTTGKLGLDASLASLDAAGARSQGHFDKVNLDISRLQQLSGPLSAYLRYSGQWARKNLDSSEKFNLGGYYGVRAYPLGEGVGDQGRFVQAELRRNFGAVTPFVFYDWGKAHSNVLPWDANSAAQRTVSGGGVGVRSLVGLWSIDGSIAWRGQGGVSTTDGGSDRNPRVFLMVGRRF